MSNKKERNVMMINGDGFEPTSPGLSPGVLAPKLPVRLKIGTFYALYKLKAESKRDPLLYQLSYLP